MKWRFSLDEDVALLRAREWLFDSNLIQEAFGGTKKKDKGGMDELLTNDSGILDREITLSNFKFKIWERYKFQTYRDTQHTFSTTSIK